MAGETDEKGDEKRNPGADPAELTRRAFVAATAAAGLVAASGAVAAIPGQVVERDVRIETKDGVCDAAYFHPPHGRHPGALIWTDVFGLRPTFRAFGRRLAALGYAVLVPNPFYRHSPAPVITGVSTFDFKNAADMRALQRWTSGLFAPGAVERDAAAYVGFLDREPQVDPAKELGTQGYCMGGPLVLRTAALLPDRIGAGASFHGGGLVTDKPDSPHLLAPKIRARMYFAIAASDDERQPDAKVKLREAFAAAGVAAEIEVYPGTIHGWCVPDMPLHDGKPIYNAPDAERAWGRLIELYRTALA
ncbi:MAG TPA: dienelactone hydrolase family protein [Steroidobacteraceae bacterium]|nr:dienelactone hydrolase family protein [Steroidobacteraceae bacterium]